MRNLFSPQPTVINRIWQLFGVMVLLLLVLVAALYWSLARVSDLNLAIKQTELIQRELRNLGEAALNAETGQRGFLITHETPYLEPYYAGLSTATQSFQRLRALPLSAANRVRVNSAEKVFEKRTAILKETVALGHAGHFEAAISRLREGQGKLLMDEFGRIRNEAAAYERQTLDNKRERVLREFNYVLWGGAASVALAIALLSLATIHTTRRLGPPIAALLDGIHAMSLGQLDHRVNVMAPDEIGRIADAFNDMAAKALAARQTQQAIQAELERSNADLDGFAYVASHDLKAPLRGIKNLAQWIDEDIGSNASAETKENLHLLNRRVDRLDKLLESLLAYSRVGRKIGITEKIDTQQLIDEISEYLAPPAGFVIRCIGKMPLVFSPKAPLEQVFRNLINNAIKHHDHASGEVLISAEDLGEYLRFSVADDGPGIAAEFHERIFQMFQTLRPRDEREGSGMGLAIVKKTVENFGGRITVRSESQERGTEFLFTWPKLFGEARADRRSPRA